MKKQLIIILLFLFAGSSCTKNSATEDVIVINPDNSRDYYLEDIASFYTVVPIQAEVPIDAIQYAQCYGDEVFLISRKGHKIYYLNKGELITVFDKKGKGPGEYITMDTFGYSPEKHEIAIFSFSNKVLYLYDVPSMKFKKHIPLDMSVYTMKYDSEGLLYAFVLSHSSKESEGSIKTINTDDGRISHVMNSDFVSISFTGDCSFYNNKLVYACPGFINRLLLIGSSKIDTIVNISYGKRNLPSKYYECKSGDLTYASFPLYFEDNNCCGFPNSAIISDNGYTLWYVSKMHEQMRIPSDLQMLHKSKDDSLIHAKSIKVKGLDLKIQPIGFSNDYYMTLIDGVEDDISDNGVLRSELGDQIIKASEQQPFGNPVMLIYKF
ncbi:MAG: 6-bladed beta-propeller [Prolixibacteraceae bacterium]|nr:6-bladed beta-propeller [Prolixibacteraceae bacterium]